MTDKLKCPFCGEELNDYPDKTTGARMAVCRNPKCKYDSWHFPIDITQRMIDGKKAQDELKYAKEELKCAKHNYSVLSEQKEIAYQNYLKITSDLQTQLQKTQEALKVAIDALSKIDAFNCHDKGAIEIIAGMTSIANRALYEITSITKQEK